MTKVLKEQQGKVLIYNNKAFKYPEPTKSWFYVTEYDSNGYPIKAKTIGCSGNIPHNPFLGAYSNSYLNFITTILQEFELNEGITELPHYSFQYCTSLKKITLPKSLTSFGNCVFRGCTSLTNVTIPRNITNMGTQTFQNCTKLSSVIIENGVSILGESTFESCTSLTSITIPDSVTSIGNASFRYCSVLTSITLPSSITTLGSYLFKDCSNLTSIEIPSGVTNIVGYAFSGCSSCLLFDFRKATQVPTMASTTVFQSTSDSKKIVVPDALYDSWITATNWSSRDYNIVTSIIKASDYEASL